MGGSMVSSVNFAREMNSNAEELNVALIFNKM
jgi:hypothetical protein